MGLIAGMAVTCRKFAEKKMQATCKNCGAPLTGRFCSNCGQKSDIHDFSFKHIIHEIIHAFTHADKNFFLLAKKMLFNPAKVAHEYLIEGKRQRYYNPFAFFLIITAANAFIQAGLLNLREKIFHDNNEYAKLFNAYNKLMLLVIVPVIALAVFGLYHGRSRRRYSEYTVFTMMLLSMQTVIDIIINATNFLLVYIFKVYRGIDEYVLYVVIIAGLFAIANYRFHAYFKDRSVLKAMSAGIMYVVITALINMFIVWAFLRDFHGLGVFSMYGIRISG